MLLDNININFNNKIKVYAFVGPSGTGKSYRAQMVAGEYDIHYIIDDGLFIKDNEVIAGNSAKKAPTKIETVKHALFLTEEEKLEIKKAIKKYKPESILILGTSDGMVEKIADNLNLPKIEKIIYIDEIATKEEMETAKRIRVTEGKHVIPVPTFEIKKDFSGYILDPLQIFKTKGRGKDPYISEKSIIRPTFSYLGNYTISDNVLKDLIEYAAKDITGIYKMQRIKIDTYSEGLVIFIDVTLEYGHNLMDIMKQLKTKVKKDIDRLTAMNVLDIQITAKGLHILENKE